MPHDTKDLRARLEMLRDEVDILTGIIESEGHTSTGSMGQTVMHPAVNARHQAVAQIAKLESLIYRMERDVEPEPEASPLDEFLKDPRAVETR